MLMKISTNFIILPLFLFLIVNPVTIFASGKDVYYTISNDNNYFKAATDSVYITTKDNVDLTIPVESSSGNKNDSSINWHKVLGWSTLGIMTVTITTGFIIPDKYHCGLAGFSTGLAVATCADGIYEYGGLISFTDGDWKYNTHAILGCLATAGFITTLSLADGKAHVATGITSGAAFTIALGVIYF